MTNFMVYVPTLLSTYDAYDLVSLFTVCSVEPFYQSNINFNKLCPHWATGFIFYFFTFVYRAYCFNFGYSDLPDCIIEYCSYDLFLSVLPVSVIKDSNETKLEEVRREISLIQAKLKLDSSALNHKEFRLFINGLYQAEGITGVYFPPLKDSLRVVFYFSIGQNYSPEAALLFLRLKAILGVGSIRIDFNNTGKIHIRYVVSNTDDILKKVIPYF